MLYLEPDGLDDLIVERVLENGKSSTEGKY